MILRIAFLFVSGLALGALGLGGAFDALTSTSASTTRATVSTNNSAHKSDPRVLRAGQRTRLPQTLPAQPR
jgi:hypothetical protein